MISCTSPRAATTRRYDASLSRASSSGPAVSSSATVSKSGANPIRAVAGRVSEPRSTSPASRASTTTAKRSSTSWVIETM